MAEDHNQKPPTVRYGLDNPHPLSQLKTELVWEGKYDEYGNRRTVDAAALWQAQGTRRIHGA